MKLKKLLRTSRNYFDSIVVIKEGKRIFESQQGECIKYPNFSERLTNFLECKVYCWKIHSTKFEWGVGNRHVEGSNCSLHVEIK